MKREDQKLSASCSFHVEPWTADAKGQKSAVENALIGTPVADPKKPLEVLRTVHSFDPCIACAVHVIDPKTNEIYEFKVS